MKNKLSKVDLDIPIDGKMPRGEYIRLMGDLMVASLQRGLTNVATYYGWAWKMGYSLFIREFKKRLNLKDIMCLSYVLLLEMAIYENLMVFL